MAELAAQIQGAAEHATPTSWPRRGIELMLAEVRASLERLRVHMDRFSLEQRAPRPRGRARSAASTGVYESEGATWLRTTEFGDDKDRVLRRANGELTYFGPDIAYHADKLARGYDRADRRAGAPTTTATSSGRGRRGRRSAAIQTGWRS